MPPDILNLSFQNLTVSFQAIIDFYVLSSIKTWMEN